MDAYPLDLVLAVATAWTTVFLGRLSTGQLRAPHAMRQVIGAGVGWMAVAALAPTAIVHFYVLIGLVCFGSWWQLRRDEGLRGKMWLILGAGLGISLGVVLILAVTPAAFPAGLRFWPAALRLASIHLGGAVVGLAYTLFVLTRRDATRAGVPQRLVERYAGLLVRLLLLRAAVLAAGLPSLSRWEIEPGIGLFVVLILLAGLARIASRLVHSPAPSTSGGTLIMIGALGFAVELAARWLLL